METRLKDSVRQILEAQGIDLCGALPLSMCKLYNEGLLMRKLPDCRSVLLFAVPYYNGAHPERNVSLYAAPKDYHLYFSHLEAQIVPLFQHLYPAFSFALTADHSPIDERDAAWQLGLGVRGDNRLLITKEYGSYVFLAELLSDLPAQDYYENECLPVLKPVEECLHCGACLCRCPSKENCLSALSQRKGELSEDEIALLLKSGILWGCDVCQSVCPLNRDVKQTPIEFFKSDTLYCLTSEMVEQMPKEEFKQRAFAFRGKNTILRNLKLYEEQT